MNFLPKIALILIFIVQRFGVALVAKAHLKAPISLATDYF